MTGLHCVSPAGGLAEEGVSQPVKDPEATGEPFRTSAPAVVATYTVETLASLEVMMTSSLDDDSAENELLLALLDGPFKRLRDDNHVDPYSILVYDRSRQPVMEAVPILELLGRYPCADSGAKWTPRDFVKILNEKNSQYRKSVVSHEISGDDPYATPACGTVVFIISQNVKRPHRWVAISALIEIQG